MTIFLCFCTFRSKTFPFYLIKIDFWPKTVLIRLNQFDFSVIIEEKRVSYIWDTKTGRKWTSCNQAMHMGVSTSGRTGPRWEKQSRTLHSGFSCSTCLVEGA